MELFWLFQIRNSPSVFQVRDQERIGAKPQGLLQHLVNLCVGFQRHLEPGTAAYLQRKVGCFSHIFSDKF